VLTYSYIGETSKCHYNQNTMARLKNLLKDQVPHFMSVVILMTSLQAGLKAQCDCAYPILFIHGWTGDYTSWDPLYTDADFMSAWGGLSDRYDAVLNATTQSNAYGADGTPLNADDDALFQFVNQPNDLLPGCIYAIDFDWFWNLDQTNPLLNLNNPPSGESDSNSSSIEKQGWAVGQAITAILQANPLKEKVILAGHSMGGLAGREYLQRFENGSHTWWVDPSDPVDGHKVAKLVTTGTPHRGSNASLGNLGSIFSFDEQSEAVRDLRFSYSTGILSPRDPAPYLFYGPEDDNVDASYFKSGDVDCDGDYDTNLISSLNVEGIVNPWDGTYDNPSMPLPVNVKYSYYTSYSAQDITLLQFNGGDGIVADERQWIYTGGDGSTGDFQSGNSIPAPSDGVDYRLSDRVHSADNVFHTSQTGDVDDLLRVLDEPDYPVFAYEVMIGTDYSAFASLRADYVPFGSEYTGLADRTIDGDWFYIDVLGNFPGLDVFVTPHPGHAGRIDVYTTSPSDYSNANAALYSASWASGSGQQQVSLNNPCYPPGRYFIRVTHENLVTSSWQTPYKFRVDEVACMAPTGLSANVTALTATLNWTPMTCATQYTVRYREVGDPNWTSVVVSTNSYNVTGLLPDTDYEFEVSTDCGVGFTSFSALMPFSTTACPNILYIPSDPALTFVPNGIYNVARQITSDGIVDLAGNVTYYAGSSIELLRGFEVESGGQFLAAIQNCVPSPFQENEQFLKRVNVQNKIITEDIELVNNTNLQKFYIQSVPQSDGTVLIKYNDPKQRIQTINFVNAERKVLTTYDELITKKSVTTNGEFSIDTNTLKPGKYLVEFNLGSSIRQIKVVKRPEGEQFRSRN